MSAEGYRIRRLDQNTELISTPPASKVEPFPSKSWNEPLPIALEGRPLPPTESEKAETKSLTRFYPPLLLLSTTLTGVFLYLYLSKPVIIENPTMTVVAPEVIVNEPAKALVEESPVVEELSPFPEAVMLGSNELPGFEVSEPEPSVEALPSLQQTILGVEQIVEVESLNGELEKLTVSLPVLYPEDMLSWSEESIAEARLLAKDIELYLSNVQAIQESGIQLLEDWNRIVFKTTPSSVLESNEALGINE